MKLYFFGFSVFLLSIFNPVLSQETDCVWLGDSNENDRRNFQENNALKYSTSALSNLICDERIFNISIAYTPDVFIQELNSNPEELLNNARVLVQGINSTFINSGMNVRARLVHCFVLSQSEGVMPTTTDQAEMAQIRDSTKSAHMSRLNFIGDGFWDDIWDHRSRYKISITALISNNDYGGRAQRSQIKKFVIYGWSASNRLFDGFGLAHEIGHCLGLEHRRGSFSAIEKVLLDVKKAYGFRGTNFSTVMIQGSDLNGTTAVLRYSDPGENFPDGQNAGDDKAQAALRAQNSISLLTTLYSDEQRLPNTLTIDFKLADNSYSLIQVQNNIIIEHGFKADLGSSFLMETGIGCLSE